MGSFRQVSGRFVCRRRPVRLILSNQGTSFVGAEWREGLKEIDKNKMGGQARKLNCDLIELKMNILKAGGIWEC